MLEFEKVAFDPAFYTWKTTPTPKGGCTGKCDDPWNMPNSQFLRRPAPEGMFKTTGALLENGLNVTKLGYISATNGVSRQPFRLCLAGSQEVGAGGCGKEGGSG